MSFSVLNHYISLRHEQSVYLYTPFIICYFLRSVWCTIILFCFASHSITSISGSLSNVCGYVLALVVKLLGIGYLVVEDVIH